MDSYCFEVKTNCGSCGNPIPINAFTENIYCEKCGKENKISSDFWNSLITDNIKDISDFSEGEGQNSKIITGSYEFTILYGKQKARCGKCKTTIPEEVFNTFEEGHYKCAKCNNIIFIRKPSEFIKNIVPSAMFIAGEEEGQLGSGVKDTIKKDNTKPVIFTCPSCAANLEVDGSERIVTCKSCDSKVYLPDDLWFSLNPAKTVNRWYVMIDEKSEIKLPDFYSLADVAADNDGNMYVVSDYGDDDKFILWSFSPDAKLRWARKDINFEVDDSGIAVTGNGKLYLWNKNKKSLLVYSCKDGSDVTTIKGSDPTDENPYPFTMKGCEALISDSDNTILAVVNNAFVRFYDDGSRAPLWGTVSEKGEKPGFFSKLFEGAKTEIKIPSDDSEWAPGVKEIGNHPARADGSLIKMNLGYDGNVYIMDNHSESYLAKYNRSGVQDWKRENILKNVECKPFADKDGNVYLLGTDEDDKTKLIRYSDNGHHIDTILNDVLEGGVLSTDSHFTLSPDGTICTYKYYDFLKIFTPDLKLVYESKQSKEEGRKKIEEKNKKIAAEE
jgi:Zn finger protein HypA/HybF involved in hydrogenase expression